MRVLELFAGIGGCAASLSNEGEVVCAVDQNPYAAQVYRHNHPTTRHERWNLSSVKAERLAALDADLWWMSPPCQPFTIRGKRLDIDDRRCAALVHLTTLIRTVRPRHLALENVPAFGESRMRAFLMQALDDAGYRRRERLLCPTRLGIPMKRSRYYLVASLDSVPGWRPVRAHRRRVESYTIRPVDPDLYLDAAFLERFHGKLPISDPVGFPRVGVFTSAYGKSPVFAGSYWQDEGGVRHFSPREGLRFLDFPDGLSLAGLGFRRAWNLVGNSLSTTSVREVLRPLLQSR